MSSWRGYSSYGKSALGISLSVTGLDELYAKIEAAGNNIDDACKDAVNASLPIVEESMKEGAARHRKGVGKFGTDAVYDAIETVSAKQSGNYIYGEVGIDISKHPEAAHGVFQEYGDGHSPEFPDPFARPAIDNNRAPVKKVQRAVLSERGVQVE
jgi:HK97 gp10 family phage protein